MSFHMTNKLTKPRHTLGKEGRCGHGHRLGLGCGHTHTHQRSPQKRRVVSEETASKILRRQKVCKFRCDIPNPFCKHSRNFGSWGCLSASRRRFNRSFNFSITNKCPQNLILSSLSFSYYLKVLNCRTALVLQFLS